MAYPTAGDVLNDAALELGLLTATLTDPYASTNQNVVLLRALLKGLGRDLVREHPWSALLKTATLSTVSGTASYDLPADFDRLVPNTAWDRTTQLPMGVVTPQGWQALQARTSAGLVWLGYRLNGSSLQLYPTPTAAETLALEYVSSYWVGTPSSTTATEPTAAADVLWFPARLLVLGLKSRFLQAKGFDSSAADNAFDAKLSQAKGADGAAPTLHINGRGGIGLRLLDGMNVPETGYGG